MIWQQLLDCFHQHHSTVILLFVLSLCILFALSHWYEARCRLDEYRFRSTGEPATCACGKRLEPCETICLDCWHRHLRALDKETQR